MCFGKGVPLVKASRTGRKKNIFYTMKSCQFENATAGAIGTPASSSRYPCSLFAFWGLFFFGFFWRQRSEVCVGTVREPIVLHGTEIIHFYHVKRWLNKLSYTPEIKTDQNCFGPPSLATWMYNSRFKYFYTVFWKLFSETSLLNYCWIYFIVLCKLREEAPLLKKHKRASQQRKAFSLF